MRTVSAYAEHLVSLLRRYPSSGPAVTNRSPPFTWQYIIASVSSHGVAALLHRLETEGSPATYMPKEYLARVEDQRRATAFDNLRRYALFEAIAMRLRKQELPVIPLKGLHLAELVYGDISLRPMSDMDILVRREHVEAAVATLQGLGYGFDEDVSAAAGAMGDTTKCNLGLTHRESGAWLEVHWTLGEPPVRYARLLEDVWASARPAMLGDTEALVMAPEHLLLHVCAHLACGHVFLFSLRGLCDIAEIAHVHPTLDWSVVSQAGTRYGLGRGVSAALRLARDHLGAAIPNDVLLRLGADKLDQDMLDEALEHLVSGVDMAGELRTAPNVLALAGTGAPLAKLEAVWNRVFVPRAELSLLYGVPQRSPCLTLYYAVRLKDLLCKYTAAVWAMKVTDPELSASAARHARLSNWINVG